MVSQERLGRQAKLRLSLRQHEALNGYLFISPWFIGFLIFTAGPILALLYFSFTQWGLVDQPVFIGPANYIKMVQDPLVWHSLKVTANFTLVSVLARLILALVVALLMTRPLRGINMIRTIYFIPAVIGGVPVALLWLWVLNPDFGILNYLLFLIGITGPKWLADPDWALWALIGVSLWNIGIPMVICIAGLQSIPPHLYEAAEIDGANAWHKLWNITLPLLTPTLLFLLINQIITSFQVFDIAYVATGPPPGSPIRSTLVYLLYFYQTGFKYLNMGYASALVWVLFLIILLLTAAIFKSSNLWVFYESEMRK